MSLKVFHLVFIAASILLAAGFAFWCFQEFARDRNLGLAAAGAGSIAAMVGLLAYARQFLRHFKDADSL